MFSSGQMRIEVLSLNLNNKIKNEMNPFVSLRRKNEKKNCGKLVLLRHRHKIYFYMSLNTKTDII
jgi:hypothetical protein